MFKDCIIGTKGQTTKFGYKQVYAGKTPDGRIIRRMAHRLAWAAKHGHIPLGLIVRHRCDNPPCINPDHLELGTDADNVRDMDERGRRTTLRGEQAVNHKLTEEQVREIRDSPATGKEMAAKYQVSRGTISRIRSGQRWAHLK